MDTRKLSVLEQKNKTSNWGKRAFLASVGVCLFFIFLYGVFTFIKIHNVSRKININIGNQQEISTEKNLKNFLSFIIPGRKELQGEREGRINVLLLGRAGEKYPGKNLTDTIMIVSISVKEKKIGLLSLPRDLYVNAAGREYSSKINQLYQFGLQNGRGVFPVISAVEEVTGLNIHYFLVLDFEGFQKIIDNVGGINIAVERDIYDARYPGPNYSYEVFEIKKGLHQMDGATALKYARQRHGDPEGDFGRAKRQQQIIQAVRNSVLARQTYLNPITIHRILETIDDHVKTNLTFEEIESFFLLSRELDMQNISNAVVDAWKKESLLKAAHFNTDQGAAFILVPRVGNWSEVQDLAQNLFHLEELERRKMEIRKEEAKIAIINQSNDKNLANKIHTLLREELNFQNVIIINQPTKFHANETQIIDLSEKQKIYTLDELVKKIPAELGEPSGDMIKLTNRHDIIVILGNDIVPQYSFKEASFEEFSQVQERPEDLR